jgi:hypothetical protein
LFWKFLESRRAFSISVGPLAIYACNRLTIKKKKNYIPNLSPSVKPAVEGNNLTEEDGYELRSRGPASQGFDALDRERDVTGSNPDQRPILASASTNKDRLVQFNFS